MSNASTGGEMHCRVCGFRQDEAIWGVDGQSATFNICACCGCEFGYEDCLPEGVQRHREKWITNGGTWIDPTTRPASWTIERSTLEGAPFLLPGPPRTARHG